VGGPSEEIAGAQAAADVVERAIANRAITWAHKRQVLWVDDRPSNNVFERQALEQLGIEFTLAANTHEALDKFRAQHFDLIISDMGRPPDSRAGYTLLESVRRIEPSIPFIIYAASPSAEHRAETLRRGGHGTTNRPDELFDLVMKALRTSARRLTPRSS
jgi:CheY-like chemotaxis protein